MSPAADADESSSTTRGVRGSWPTVASLALAAALALAASLAPAAVAAQGTVRGVVVDASTGDTVDVATVLLLDEPGDTVASQTTSDGRFALFIRAEGRYRLHAIALGYEEVGSDAFDANTSSEIVVEVRLGPRPVDLPALHVVSRRSDVDGPLSEYYRNLEWHDRTGFGTVLDREDLERYGSMPTSMLVGSQPGLRVVNSTRQGDVIVARKAGQSCVPQVYINGLLAESRDLLIIPLSELEGIEFYRWTLPPEFPPMAARNECGLIMAWTRPELGKPMTWTRAFIALGFVAFVFLLAQL